MTDYTELKHAAETALSLRHEDCESAQQHSRMAALYRVSFGQKASPEAILALIAENERLNESIALLTAEFSSQRDQLKAEVEALRKDAGRYRWLRDYAWLNEKGVDHMMSLDYPGLQKAEELPESAENKGAEGGLHD